MSTAQKLIDRKASSSRLEVHSLVMKFAAQAVWLDSDLEIKSHLIKMCDAIAARFGKSRLDFSIDDIHGLTGSIHNLAGSAKLAKLRFADAVSLTVRAKSAKESFDSFSDIYRVAKLVSGDVTPIVTKKLLNIAAPRLKRASITYVAGMLAIELYRDKSDSDPHAATEDPVEVDGVSSFDPIFSHFGREHLADLCGLLKIDADINAPDEELQTLIVNEFSYYTKNFFTHIYHKVSQERSPYRKVLDTVCADLKIQIDEGQTTADLEHKIIARVFQETIDKLEVAERTELLGRLSKISGVELDLSRVATGGSLAALIVGNYAGFGTYLAASSALGAITSGLGLSASFGVYTSMSSAIAVALGPIGFTAATAAFVATLSKGSPRKAIPAIIYIATMRAKLGTEINAVATRERHLKYAALAALCITSAALGYLLHFLF